MLVTRGKRILHVDKCDEEQDGDSWDVVGLLSAYPEHLGRKVHAKLSKDYVSW